MPWTRSGLWGYFRLNPAWAAGQSVEAGVGGTDNSGDDLNSGRDGTEGSRNGADSDSCGGTSTNGGRASKMVAVGKAVAGWMK